MTSGFYHICSNLSCQVNIGDISVKYQHFYQYRTVSHALRSFCQYAGAIPDPEMSARQITSVTRRFPSMCLHAKYCIVLYCIVLYCGRVPVANAPRMHCSRMLIVQTLVFSRSFLHRQVSPPETLVVKRGTTWARNGR